VPHLEVRNLVLHYETLRGVVHAVDSISFDIEKGETLGVVGESGCGKSSTANAILRLLPKNVEEYTGEVRLNGTDIMELDDEQFRTQIRWKRIAMVFQGAMNSLSPVLKIGFQVAEPLVIHEKMPQKEAMNRTRELFKKVGLPPEFTDRYPHELSGGMKQRVVISMALILKPELLLLDEPTSALDVSIQAQIMNLLKDLKKEFGVSMIFITHDIALASDICDKLVVMYAGQISEYGTIEDLLEDPKHPYSRKLIDSIPLLRTDKKPDFIPGAPPDLISPPTGCRFHPRCPYVMPICRTDMSPMFTVGRQLVRCWLFEKEAK